MKRRNFLKTGLTLGSLTFLNPNLLEVFSTPQDDNSKDSDYAPGNQISPQAFVLDKNLNKHKLIDLCNDSNAKVVFLYIFGGAALKHSNRLGNIWCPDSFEDVHVMRYVHSKYHEGEVKVLPVACPPVYSSQYYDFDDRVFLDETEASKKFKEAAENFIAKNEEIVQSGLIPTESYYDLRFRLLFNRSENLQPNKNYGPIFEWQGKFRSPDEEQKYGTPTLWLLNSEGIILEQPFWGNIYHSDPYTIRYTVLDVDNAIQRNLEV